MITLDGITREYFYGETVTRALAGITLRIDPGEFVAIMGPSGSGKSTLLHLLGFLDRPSAGSYLFRGANVAGLSDGQLARLRNRAIGFVFQSFNLLLRATVYENVSLPLLYSSLPVSERHRTIERVVGGVGLSEKLSIETGRLSGGQQQRAAIARALVNNPEMIAADEPTGNLDSRSGKQIMEILADLNRQGRTIIVVTHDQAVARYAHRLILLKDGLVESDTPYILNPIS